MLTVKELAELFGISRQAMRKHADNLEPTYLAKNSQGIRQFCGRECCTLLTS